MKQLKTLLFLSFCWLSTTFAQPLIRGTHEVSSYNQVISIPVSVQHFTEILKMRYSVNWDPTLLEFLSISEIGGIDNLGNDDFNFSGTPMGNFVMDWDDSHPVLGTTIPDFTQIYKINFLVRGGPGTCANVSFTNTPTLIDVRRVSIQNNIGLIREHGKVTIPSAPCRAEDSLALVQLYQQTNGSAWTNPWNLNQPLHTWQGVNISLVTGCVETVDLDGIADGVYSPNGNGRNLMGTLPDLVLPNVKKLYLSHNRLSGNIPNFTYTNNLTQLTLNDNQFTFSPALNQNMVLSELFIQNNQLTFDDIVPNMSAVDDAYLYAQQALVFAPTTVNLSPGSNYTIDLGIDPQMSNNVYHWFKDGHSWATITGNNKLAINNISSNEAGVYTCEITNPQAQDLILRSHPVTLELDCVDNLTSLAASICQGAVYEMAGVEYSESGFYQATLTNSFGCDSMIQLSLVILPPPQTTRNESICEGEVIRIGNNDYTETGFYQTTLTSTTGCDSIVHLNLVVHRPVTTNLIATICEGESYPIGNVLCMETGNYQAHLMTSAGCDSTVFLNLTVIDVSETFLNKSICEGASYSVGPSTYTTSGDYQDILSTTSGCDSIVYLQLQVVEILEESVTITVCPGDSYWIGHTRYSTTGNYQGTLTSTNGCDSIVFLNLIVSEAIMTDLEATICDGGSYEVGDSIYTATGNYQNILTTVSGCDSLVNLHLNVTSTLETFLEVELCTGETYPIGNNIYNETGDYENHFTATTGCDSIVYLSLVFNEAVETHLEAQLCPGAAYTLGNTNYSQTGMYQHTFSTINGCDSTVYLNLEITTSIEISQAATICAGESYTIGENTYQQTGDYTVVLNNSTGCDSIIHLALTVVNEATFGQAVIGQSQMVCGEEVTLTGNLPAGTFGYWQTEGNAVIENDENAVTTAQHLDAGLNVFTWTLSTNECAAFSSASVDVNAQHQTPQAVVDSILIDFGDRFTTINLLENDEFNGTDNWTFRLINIPDRGIARENELGVIDFSSPPGYYGVAEFSYELCNKDCPQYCSEAVVFIQVEQPQGVQPSIIITPNGDGLNETLVFYNLNDFPNNELVITNRWGSIVYEAKDYQNNWLGQNKSGNLLPEGTYYYMMQYDLSEGKYEIGSVTIKR